MSNKDRERAEYLRGQLDNERLRNRQDRSDRFYGGYRGRPVVVYNDSYHPMFGSWLTVQSPDIISLWLYHHQASMDRARYNALLSQLSAQNAALHSQVNAQLMAMNQQGVAVNPNYVPTGLDADLMYSDGFVEAATAPPVGNPRRSGFTTVFTFLAGTLCVCVLGGVTYYFIFVRRYE